MTVMIAKEQLFEIIHQRVFPFMTLQDRQYDSIAFARKWANVQTCSRNSL